MKCLQTVGVGSIQMQAEPITEKEEEIPWDRKMLGDHSPEALSNTMFYVNGLNFALHIS